MNYIDKFLISTYNIITNTCKTTTQSMVKGLPFEATLPETTITRAEAKNAFYEVREQTADVLEMMEIIDK